MKPVLTFEIGGARSLAALVQDRRVLDVRRLVAPRGEPAGAWLQNAARLVESWRGRVERAVILADAGSTFPAELERLLGMPVAALDETRAAAWGEHRFGAGRDRDMVYARIGTRITGAVIIGGRLVTGARGMAGRLGALRAGAAAASLDDLASGVVLARQAAVHGASGAAGVFAAASAGAGWAPPVVDGAAAALAAALGSVQAILDPDCIVLGGGIGVATGFVDRVRVRLSDLPPPERPVLAAGLLGADAGLIGAADLAVQALAT